MSARAEVRYRSRLRVTNSQAVLLQAVFDTCRFVWNQTLGRWEDLWCQERIMLSYTAADGELTDWRSRFEWLAEQPSAPTSVTVYRDPVGRWWASFVVRLDIPTSPVHGTGRATGLDLGLDTFATVENPAHDIPNPRLARARANALARSQRCLARTRKGSANRAKARRRMARIEATTAARRIDFHHKAARSLMRAYDRIGVEDLAVKHWSRRGRGRRQAGLNRSIADAGWGQFLRVLAWQASKTGKQVVLLHGWGSTQECSSCGVKAKPRLELSDRVCSCEHCGLVLDRDRNAARNLHPDHPRNHRLDCTGAGDDGGKTSFPAGTEAA
jgi:putative transposase